MEFLTSFIATGVPKLKDAVCISYIVFMLQYVKKFIQCILRVDCHYSPYKKEKEKDWKRVGWTVTMM